MNKPVLFVCKSCGFSAEEDKREGMTGGEFLLDRLLISMENSKLKEAITIQKVGCLCLCDNPCAIAITSLCKHTLIFADLPPDSIVDDLLTLCELYLETVDGFVPRYLLPDRLQATRLASIPPVQEFQ